MKIQKLNLKIDESKLEKQILQDISAEINLRNKFSFLNSKPKGHKDYVEESSNHSDFGIGSYHSDFKERRWEEKKHTDHVDYVEAYLEQYKEYTEHSDYKELPKRHRDF